MADTFKAGDTVRFKSGGPLMVVDSVNGEEIYCEWFDDKNNPQGRTFKPHVLVKDDGGPIIA
jgi:uncharacterized protein YodC (DUF2158 family)